MTVRVFWNLIPGRRLVRHRDAALLGDFTEFKTHVTDVRSRVFALGHKLRNLFGRSHVRVLRLDLVLRLQITPGFHPVCPGVGHAHRIDGAFLLRGLQKGFHFRSGGLYGRHGQSGGGNKRCSKRVLHGN